MTSPRPTMRWFGHPAIVLALVAFLVADFLSIQSDPPNRSTVCEFLLPAPRVAVSPRQLPGMALRTSDGIEWIWIDDGRWNTIEDYGQPIWIGHHSIQRDLGFYHLTRRRETLLLTHGADITAEEVAELRPVIAIAIDSHASLGPAFQREQRLLSSALTPRAGAYVLETPLGWGYLRNGLAALALTLLLVCIFVGGPWLWKPAFTPGTVRRRRRMSKGQCLWCGYDLRGIPATVQCPECGERRV